MDTHQGNQKTNQYKGVLHINTTNQSIQRSFSFGPSLINISIRLFYSFLIQVTPKNLFFHSLFFPQILRRHLSHTLFHCLMNVSQTLFVQLLIPFLTLLQYLLDRLLTTLFTCALQLLCHSCHLWMDLCYLLCLKVNLLLCHLSRVPPQQVPL